MSKPPSSDANTNPRPYEVRRKKRRSHARPIGTIIHHFMAKNMDDNMPLRMQMLLHWPDIVGHEMARYSWVEGVTFSPGQKRATLRLGVDSAHILAVQHQTDEIRERIAVYFGYPVVERIKLLAQEPAPLASSALPLPLEANKAVASSVPDSTIKAWENQMQQIDDPALKQALSRLLTHAYHSV